MPPRKRYYTASHTMNRDPEFRELRKLYDDWMGFVWHEMCSIGDEHEGIIVGTIPQVADSLSYISLWSHLTRASRRIVEAINTMQDWSWIAVKSHHDWLPSAGTSKLVRVLVDRQSKLSRPSVDAQSHLDQLSTITPPDCVLVVNYAKYHRTWEPERCLFGSLLSDPIRSDPLSKKIGAKQPANESRKTDADKTLEQFKAEHPEATQELIDTYMRLNQSNRQTNNRQRE